jgi:hypothetical protein
MWFLLFVIYT